MSNLLHLGSWAKGFVWNWYPTDSEELYNKNFSDPANRKLLEQYGWIDAKITYDINSHGFRSPEFDTRKNFVTLGCSLTTGIGLPVEQTWPWYLSKNLNIDYWNLSVPGGSSDTAYRIAEYYLSVLKPDFVVMLEPSRSRFELFQEGGPETAPTNYSTTNSDLDNWFNNTIMKNWIANTHNQDLHAIKNIKSIAYQCVKLGIDFYLYTSQYFLDFLRLIPVNYARDLMHPGQLTNFEFASTVCNDILNKHTYE